jgi:hypothetical protein
VDIDRLANVAGIMRIYDAKGHPVLLFESDWRLRWTTERETSVSLHEAAP